MRYLRRSLPLAGILLLAITLFAPGAVARQQSTPEAATPVATDPLFGRLGGSLDSVVATFGTPDFTADGLVRYDAVMLDGLPTILVVSYDDAEQVTRLTLVYTARPEALTTAEGILAAAATVAPADGTCQTSATSTDAGAEVYPCHSRALMSAFTAERLAALGATGALGDYSVAVDPLPDAWFELVILPGANGNALAPTPVPGEPTPGPTPTLAEQYPTLTDPRDLMDGDIALDEPLSFSGEILTLQVAETGKQFHLGQDESLGVTSLFQVRVPVNGSSDEQVIFVGYSGDASGLAIGGQVTVYGANYGTQCFENAMGDEVCQPLIAADQVETERPS